jgi:hypothetical protein
MPNGLRYITLFLVLVTLMVLNLSFKPSWNGMLRILLLPHKSVFESTEILIHIRNGYLADFVDGQRHVLQPSVNPPGNRLGVSSITWPLGDD